MSIALGQTYKINLVYLDLPACESLLTIAKHYFGLKVNVQCTGAWD